jgi:2-C-methyl-D-erythritol 4-phosphate cytidylyltransferase/2-C-methyl-D-erythritol 2,4-cyclodiphosphate synthase
MLGGEPVLTRTLRAFLRHPAVETVSCVIHQEDEAAFEAAVAPLGRDVPFVHGGADRQASVRLGLEASAGDPPDLVLIHDGARPLVSEGLIDRVLEALGTHDGALAALPVSDTLKREARVGATPLSAATAPREGLWRAQTPQGFRFRGILDAHEAAPAGTATDDASLLEEAGREVALVEGEASNIKLTYGPDFDLAEAILVAGTRREVRTGLGYDVHAFAEGGFVTLCGVRVPHSRGLKGHSDADVGMHALTDALYGAIAEGDIGRHFPPTEERWRGAESRVFLAHAAGLLREKGGRLVNADVTLICEAPKVSPHASAMREALAAAMGCDPGRVSVKATTTEGLGFEGRREGIAAQAVCTIELPA